MVDSSITGIKNERHFSPLVLLQEYLADGHHIKLAVMQFRIEATLSQQFLM